jgi:hypothetical protein
MLLDTTSKSLTVTASNSEPLDVVVFFVDMDAATTQGKNLNFAITSAGVTTIVPAPAASTERQIKSCTIRNKGSVACVVTIALVEAGTPYETHQRTIEAGRTLAYDPAVGRWGVGGDDLFVRAGFSSGFFKVGTSPEAAGVHYCFAKDAGWPGAFLPGTPGINGRDTNNDPGSLYLPTISGKEIWLTGFSAFSANPCGPELWDLMWINSGLAITTTTAQAISIAYVPSRDVNGTSSGEGDLVGLLVTSATTNAVITGGVAAGQMQLSYTNSQGTSGRIATPITFPATCTAGSVVWFRLAAGDTGVRSVQSITFGTSLGAGAVSLFIGRRLAKAFAVAGYNAPAQLGAGVRVFEGATLVLMADVVSPTVLTVSAEANFEYR